MENLDLLLTANLLNNVFKRKASISVEYLGWQYQKNPAGSACIGESPSLSSIRRTPTTAHRDKGSCSVPLEPRLPAAGDSTNIVYSGVAARHSVGYAPRIDTLLLVLHVAAVNEDVVLS